jgi:hypothetical protein
MGANGKNEGLLCGSSDKRFGLTPVELSGSSIHTIKQVRRHFLTEEESTAGPWDSDGD